MDENAKSLPREAQIELGNYMDSLANSLGMTKGPKNLAELNKIDTEFFPAIENKLNSLLQKQEAVGALGNAMPRLGRMAQEYEAAGAIGNVVTSPLSKLEQIYITIQEAKDVNGKITAKQERQLTHKVYSAQDKGELSRKESNVLHQAISEAAPEWPPVALETIK